MDYSYISTMDEAACKAWGYVPKEKVIPRISQQSKQSMENGHFPLRLISFNTLQPVYTIANNLYYILKRTPGYSDRHERARDLYGLLLGYDLCCLQEFSNDVSLERILNVFNIRGGLPQPVGNVNKVIHACDHANPNGGLLTLARSDLRIIWYDEYKFSRYGTEEFLNRSASFCLLNMNNYWEGKYLLVCNVHFHTAPATDDDIVREQQRGELFDYFITLSDKLFPLNFSWENCGVIITGCFNASDTSISNNNVVQGLEYKKILECFGPAHDLMAGVSSCRLTHTFNTDLNKYADPKRANDTSRMDYIISLDSIPGKKGISHKTMPLTAESADILTDITISDHYPIVANIVPRIKAPATQSTNIKNQLRNWY